MLWEFIAIIQAKDDMGVIKMVAGQMERKVIHTENDMEVSLIELGHKLNEERRE